VQFSLRRAGNRLLVGGKADLTTVPVDKADFQLKITTSGEVLETNGDADAGTASWTFDAGKVGDVNAVIAVADPNAPSPTSWTLLTATLVVLACGVVVLLARRTRNPPVPRPDDRAPTPGRACEVERALQARPPSSGSACRSAARTFGQQPPNPRSHPAARTRRVVEGLACQCGTGTWRSGPRRSVRTLRRA
jgi:hypothetical protein